MIERIHVMQPHPHKFQFAALKRHLCLLRKPFGLCGIGMLHKKTNNLPDSDEVH